MTDSTTPATPAPAAPASAPAAITGTAKVEGEIKADVTGAVAKVESWASSVWAKVKSHLVVGVAGGVAGHLSHGFVAALLAKLF